MTTKPARLALAVCALLALAGTASADWKPAAAPLMTKWGKQVTPENAWTGVPPAAAGPQGLAEPQRPVGLRHHRQGRRQAREVGRADPRAVLRRVGAVRRRQARQRRTGPVVPAHVRGAGRVEGPARAAALRGGGLGGDRLRQRQGARHAPRRVRPVHLRHHRRPQGRRGERGGRPRLGPDRHRRAAARQAGAQARAASGTRPSPASGRRSGWSRCREAHVTPRPRPPRRRQGRGRVPRRRRRARTRQVSQIGPTVDRSADGGKS